MRDKFAIISIIMCSCSSPAEPTALDIALASSELDAASESELTVTEQLPSGPEYTHCLRPTPEFVEVAGEQGLRLVEAAFLLWGPYRVELSDHCSVLLDAFDADGALGATLTEEDAAGTPFVPFVAINSELKYWVNGPYNGGHHLASVIAHEIGHLLGYDTHDSRDWMIMSDSLRPGDVRMVTGDDRAELARQRRERL